MKAIYAISIAVFLASCSYLAPLAEEAVEIEKIIEMVDHG